MERKDVLLKTTKALPAAGATNTHDSIDLGAVTPGPTVRDFALRVSLPATPSLADTKSVTLTIKDSADNSTFAAIEECATIVATGSGGAGASAVSRDYKLPENVKRYIRVDQAVEASGGTNTGITVTAELVF